MWSDGQGVHATWPSPFAPHIRIDGTWQAVDTRREAGRLIHSLIRSFLFRVVARSFLSVLLPHCAVRRSLSAASGRWGIHCREAKPRGRKEFVEEFSNSRGIFRAMAERLPGDTKH